MSGPIIGESIPRVDARPKVTGAAGYTVNLERPGMLQARVLRSPYPHARILRIDTARAEALPGVAAVLSRADFPGGVPPCYGPVVRDQPVVAGDRVRYVGDAVAAVAAADSDTAERALELIEVEYAPLPVVADIAAAIAADAPVLHENVVADVRFADLKGFACGAHGNICAHFKLRHGDPDGAMAAADHVFTDVYETPVVQHVPLEPLAVLVAAAPDGSAEVWTPTHTPFPTRSLLAGLAGVPEHKIHVRVPPAGGNFGSRSFLKLEPIAYFLSRKTGRPVKIVLSREETFLTIAKHAAVIRIRSGVRHDGTLLARIVTLYWDTGAYAEIGPRVAKNAGVVSPGPYRIPNVHVDSYCVYSNKVPAGAFRGYGIPQAAWAYEQHTDRIAAALGMDPLAFRLQNVARNGDTFYTGERLEDLGVAACLEAVAAETGAARPAGPEIPASSRPGTLLRGWGVSCLMKTTVTPSLSSAVVKLDQGGGVTVITGTVDVGQGAHTVLGQMCAAALGARFEQVQVGQPDTDTAPYDYATASSRSTFMMGRAVIEAAQEVRTRLLAAAAPIFGVAAADLDTADGDVFVRAQPARRRSFAAVLADHFGAPVGSLIGQGTARTSGGLDPETGQGLASAFYSAGAAACEVEVDTETGRVQVRRLLLACDAGRAINPALCHGQILGSAVMGLGSTLTEELRYADGIPLNPNLLDYTLPNFTHLPADFQSIVVEVPHRHGPHGAHGVGETAVPLVAPAVGNAIRAATGVVLRRLPLLSDQVLQALRQGMAPPPAIAERVFGGS